MDRDALLERALALADDEDWEGAAELLRDHLADFDGDAAFHCWLGVAERQLGMDGVAYERFKRALALQPEDPYILATAGNGISHFDDADAELALRTAAILGPEVALARLFYGAYLAREGFPEDALRELTAAREIDPDDPQITYELGVAYALQDNFDLAADALATAVTLDPDDGWARVVFGLVLVEAGRLEEATGELISGARRMEDDIDAQLAACLASGATGRDGMAYEMLERARMRSAEGDLMLVAVVEDLLDGGHEAAEEMLRDDFGPNLLRTRLSERP